MNSATGRHLKPVADLEEHIPVSLVKPPPVTTRRRVADAPPRAATGRWANRRRRIAALEHSELDPFPGHNDPAVSAVCRICTPLITRAANRATRTAPVVKATAVHTGYGVAGLWRAGGMLWRWVAADELNSSLATNPGMVLTERTRRRKIAVVASGACVAAVAWTWTISWALPTLILLALLGAASVLERRIRRAGDVDAGRKSAGRHPGAKVVRRAVAAAKLGKVDGIRIVGPVTRDEGRAWAAVVELPPGGTYTAALKRHGELAGALGVGVSQLAIDPVRGNNGRIAVWCADSDPLLGPPIASPLLGMDRFDFWTDKIPFGQDVRGRPFGFSMVERTVLISGEPGGGKSVACNDVLCPLALDPDFELDLVDGKQVELIDYEDIARFLLASPDPRAFLDYLVEEEAEIEARYDAMKKIRVKALTKETAADLGFRPRLLHVDELAFFTRSSVGKQITEKLRDRVSRGRAAMLLTSAATQRPSAEVIDTDLRDLISIRVGLRSTTPAASDMGLGQGWAKLGYSTSMFDPTQRGAALVLAEGTVPVRMRTTMLTDAQIRGILRRAFKLREQAGTLPKSDARPAVRLLKAVLGAFGDADRVATADLLAYLAGDLVYEPWDATRLADELRPLGVRPGDQWINNGNLRGYRRADVQRALDRA